MMGNGVRHGQNLDNPKKIKKNSKAAVSRSLK
jgi:hypothetical protein